MANIPSDIQALIDKINGNDGTSQSFFWNNFVTSYYQSPYTWFLNGNANWTDFSYFVEDPSSQIHYSDYTTRYMCVSQNIERIDIVSSGNNYTLSKSFTTYPRFSRMYNTTMEFTNGKRFEVKDANGAFKAYTGNSFTYTFTKTGTLNQIFTYIWEKFANVIIAVNGEIWSDPTPITYTWQSVASISGKNGILSLTHVRDDSLLDGGSQTFTPEQVYVTEESRVGNIMANVPIGKAIKAIYSGVAHYLGIYKNTATSFTVYMQLVENFTRRIYEKSFVTDKCYIGFILDTDQEAARVGIFYPQYDPQTEILTGYTVNFTDTDYSESDIWIWLQGGIDPDTDGPEVNKEDEGTPEEYQPDIAITGITKPSYGAIDTGFTTMYRMSKGELQRLSNFLWTDSFVSNVKKFFNDPREIIVGLSIMPVLPDTEEAPGSEVKAGGISTGVYGLKLTDQYKLETYGVIEVKAEKGNFLDYAPYTQVTAHLPFVGAHSLDVNDVMGKQLALKYIFDFLTGSCVAEIDVYDSETRELKPRYFFGGSCGIQVPSSSEDFSRMYSSILSAGATLGSALSTIATGGLTAPLLLGTASNMLANGMNGSPSVEFSSGSGSVNGMIGCKAAYLVISRPKEKVAKDQQKYVGKPSFMTRTLSDCSEFTKCLNVHLDNVPCTATERAEIERLLLDGVRIASGSATPEYTPTTASDHGLIFLKCVSDMDVIGKSWDEEDTLTVEGKLMFDQDMMTPKFVLEADTLAYNYCYIPDFGRFYYVTKQLIKTGSLTEIHLQCDVLQSWKTQILSNKAVVERSANDSNVNAYFSDSMYWTQANKEVKTVPFLDQDGNALVFEIPENNYILTIAGSD